MIEYILAVAFLNAMEARKPHMVGPMPSRSACMAAAEKANKTDEQMRDPQLRELGAEYVCLKVEKVQT